MGLRVAVREALHHPHLDPALNLLRIGRRLAVHGPARPALLRIAEQSSPHGPAPVSDLLALDEDATGHDALERLRGTGATGRMRVGSDVVDTLRAVWEADPAFRLVGVERGSPLARELLGDPLLRYLAHGYFRSPPRPLGVTLTMALPGFDPPPTLHYETSDLRTLLVYLPLQGPDDGSGGHQVVLGTHGRKPLRHIARLHHEPRRVLGEVGRTVTVYAPDPGTGWAEDPALLHRRIPATSPRLMATVGFAMRRSTPAGSCGYFRLDLPDGVDISAPPRPAALEPAPIRPG